MSFPRLQQRAPAIKFISTATLPGHELRFHKKGQDGSGKCDAFKTNNPEHKVIGVVYQINQQEKAILDKIEGLGSGYAEKWVTLQCENGQKLEATTYYAIDIDPKLQPFSWYKQHVLFGARENNLPPHYIEKIAGIKSGVDPDRECCEREIAIYKDQN